jgi:hypothetical protein
MLHPTQLAALIVATIQIMALIIAITALTDLTIPIIHTVLGTRIIGIGVNALLKI